MSTLAPLDLIRSVGCRIGVEVGVWRGDRAQALLDSCDLDRLYLVDPWLRSLNVFPAAVGDAMPARMPGQTYTCTMGEPIQSQVQLEEMALEVRRKMEPYGDRAVILRLPSELAALQFMRDSLDVVLIDAIHLYRYVKQDILTWLPLIKPGKIITGDDYADPGVARAVDEIFGAAAFKSPGWWWSNRK